MPDDDVDVGGGDGGDAGNFWSSASQPQPDTSASPSDQGSLSYMGINYGSGDSGNQSLAQAAPPGRQNLADVLNQGQGSTAPLSYFGQALAQAGQVGQQQPMWKHILNIFGQMATGFANPQTAWSGVQKQKVQGQQPIQDTESQRQALMRGMKWLFGKMGGSPSQAMNPSGDTGSGDSSDAGS